METPNDGELAVSLRDGDARAWNAVWQRHSKRVRGAVRSCIGPDCSLDDLVQETFFAVYRSIGRLERPEALRGFLVGTALHVTKVELRSRTRRKRRLCLTPTGVLPEAPVEEPVVERDAVRALERIIAALSPRLRQAFELRYVQGRGVAQVAESLGISTSKAKRLTARAIVRVRFLATRDVALSDYAMPS